MQNIRIGTKILLIIAAFGVVSVLLTLKTVRQLHYVSTEYGLMVEGDGRASFYMSRAIRAFQKNRGATAELMMAPSDAVTQLARDELGRSRADFDRFAEAARAASPNDPRIPAMAARAIEVMDRTCAGPVALRTAASDPRAIGESQRAYLRDCSPAYRAVTTEFAGLVDGLQEDAKTRMAELDAISEGAVRWSLIASFIGVLVAMGAGFLAVRAWIVRPVVAMADAMGALSGGNLEVRVPEQDRRDELGLMARALVVFRDNAARVRADEVAKERAAAAEQQRSAEMYRATQGLAQGLQRMSDGDLSAELAEPYAAEFEPLRTDFNAVARSLRDAMARVAATAGKIDEGSRGIRESARELSKRNEGQAAAVEEQSAALSQITSNVRDTSDRSEEAKKEAEKAANFAETSKTVVTSAFSAMQRIESSSKEITAISGLIDEISFQTNLLALNASVEAARAGDAGRGFAVVAQEVRELAQRSARAAQEIKELIRKSVDEVGGGVQLVLSAGEALKQIGQQVHIVNGKLDEITRSAREQVTALAEISAAVDLTDRSTQQNAAMSEETLAAASTLAAEAETLRRLLATFRLGEDAGYGGYGAASRFGAGVRPTLVAVGMAE